MKKFKRIYNTVIKESKIDILRCVDLKMIKDFLMETEIFNGVIIFNVVENIKDVKTSLFRPGIDKLNTVVNINTIQLLEYGEKESVLMIGCEDGTVIRPDDEE